MLFVIIVLSILSIGFDDSIVYESDPLQQVEYLQQGKQLFPFDHVDPITFKFYYLVCKAYVCMLYFDVKLSIE